MTELKRMINLAELMIAEKTSVDNSDLLIMLIGIARFIIIAHGHDDFDEEGEKCVS